MQSVNLSRCELIAINRCYLGGFDALRTPDYSVACSTMKSLIKKGMFEKRGLSVKAIALLKELGTGAPIC